MLIVSIPVMDYVLAAQEIARASSEVDGVELRLDYLSVLNIPSVKQLRDTCQLPVIFTLRSHTQGGRYAQDENQRLQDILALCALEPEYVDLEYDIPETVIEVIKKRHPAIQMIISYHVFDHTPNDLLTLLHQLQRSQDIIYKIASYANSGLDALRMLQFVRENSKQYRLIGICMGEDGACTRILGPMMGNVFSYGYLDEPTAPGQLSIQDLLSLYNYRQLNTETRIYALLGDPVNLSVGHILHNQAIKRLQRNAVYVKLRVNAADVEKVVAVFHSIPIDGFSITMPLKEAMVPWMDHIELVSQPIKAINGMVRQQSQWCGFNTDGFGAMRALAKQAPKLAQHTMLILGAGGAARAIAYVARQQHAQVIILNRTLAKAQALATDVGAEFYLLDKLPGLKSMPYTVIINTLPEHVFTEPQISELFHSDHIRPNIIAMDIVYQPIETTFLRLMRQANCVEIPGFYMFVHQALRQIEHWFQPKVDLLKQIKDMMIEFFVLNSV